jgi:hypothetical protein
VTELNDTFVLGWGPATDTVGVERYVVERAEGDGGFNVLSANVAGLTFTDSSLVPGLLRYQVAAIDFVQHRGPSIGLGQVWAGVADAGVADAGVADAGVADAGVADAGVADAGVTDAGVTDAGVTDAGLVDGRDGGIPETRGYEVGCGCGSLSQLAALGALIVLGRTRRRVR